jgi:hypothetical protein
MKRDVWQPNAVVSVIPRGQIVGISSTGPPCNEGLWFVVPLRANAAANVRATMQAYWAAAGDLQ